MKRGISFEIPHKYGSFLGELLKPLEIPEYIWLNEGGESYLVVEDEVEIEEPLFTEDTLDGFSLKKLIEDNEYYLIFVDLKAYSKGENPTHIETYEDFLNSNCELVLLVADSIYTTVYCKNSGTLKRLYDNARLKGFDNLQYITDKNDSRTKLSVW